MPAAQRSCYLGGLVGTPFRGGVLRVETAKNCVARALALRPSVVSKVTTVPAGQSLAVRNSRSSLSFL